MLKGYLKEKKKKKEQQEENRIFFFWLQKRNRTRNKVITETQDFLMIQMKLQIGRTMTP